MDKENLSRVWKPAVGWEGVYSVSDDGLLRREVGTRGSAAGFVTRGTKDRKGYFRMRLSNHPRRECWLAHRLVCTTFHGVAPFDGAQVLHWDDDPGNNRAANLRWGTPRENAQDAKRNGSYLGSKSKRDLTHCKRGHEFTVGNTYTDPLNRRVCRACKRERFQASRSIEGLPDDPRHGTSNGYLNLKCRCDYCKDAYSVFSKRRTVTNFTP